MIVKSSQVKYLNAYGYDYYATSVEKVTRTITKPLPVITGWVKSVFPKYLKGYEQYYERVDNLYPYWKLKPEYCVHGENRPCYTIEVTYDVIDITLTERGRKTVQNRMEKHNRLAKQYALLLE